jgi:rRNA small subunit pseudouridine methyltransferase Nep1
MAVKREKRKPEKAEKDEPDMHKRAKKRKKSLLERIDGPSEADKLLPRTRQDQMAARRIVVVLEKCALELVQPRKGAVELLNPDEHKGILAKNRREISEIRPDITHQCLMALLDSPLNKAGKLLIYLHTAQNVLIEVHPSLRIPRTFKRFAGLCVELLQRKKIRAAGANEVLMKVISNPVSKYLPPGSRRFGLSVKGRSVKMRDFCMSLEQEDSGAKSAAPVVFAIGAVAHEDPVSEQNFGFEYIEERLSICPWGLSAACCCSKVCNEFENLWDIC